MRNAHRPFSTVTEAPAPRGPNESSRYVFLRLLSTFRGCAFPLWQTRETRRHATEFGRANRIATISHIPSWRTESHGVTEQMRAPPVGLRKCKSAGIHLLGQAGGRGFRLMTQCPRPQTYRRGENTSHICLPCHLGHISFGFGSFTPPRRTSA